MSFSDKKPRPRTGFGRVLSALGQNFFAHDVGRDSAALSYYLLFAIFPMLILVSILLGLLQLDMESTLAVLSRLIPEEVVQVIESYLTYVSGLQSPRLLWFCMVFSIWFPMRAISCLTHSIRKAFGKPQPENPLKNQLLLLIGALLLIVVISLALVLIVIGRRVLELAARVVTLSPGFIALWSYGRFLILFVVVFLSIAGVYSLALGRRMPWRETLPGVSFSVCAGTLLGMLFSYYVENFGQYSILYGSIATIIVVLLWLYMTSNVLVLGAELSAELSRRRHARLVDKEDTV